MEEKIFSFFSGELILFVMNTFLIIILLIMNLSTRSKMKKLRNKYNTFMNGLSDRNMEQLLEECIRKVNVVGEKNRDLEVHINTIERDLLKCVQKIGIVRFNAFENVGS